MSMLQKHELWCALGGVAVGLALREGAKAVSAMARRRGKRVAVVLAGCGVYDGCALRCGARGGVLMCLNTVLPAVG